METPELQPGARIGSYEVERILGSGTMGVVVAALHAERRDRVAIKVLHEAYTLEPQVRDRFLREGATVRRLRSEHIVRVMQVGVLRSGRPYIVMVQLTGIDLDALLEARGPLPLPFVIDATLQACSALAEAHRAGIVHRDIKPSNFFLSERAEGPPLIKILDFGIAKSDMFRGQELTTVAVTLGSPPYMSPEQIRSSMSVDPRADVWSLGVTLFELLTGELPFHGDSLGAIVGAILHGNPRGIEALRPDLPPELAAVVARCLKKDRQERHASVDELAAELSAIARALPAPTPPQAFPLGDSTPRPPSSRRFWRTTRSSEAKPAEVRAPIALPQLFEPLLRLPLVRATRRELRKSAGPLVIGVAAGVVAAVLIALLVGVLLLSRR